MRNHWLDKKQEREKAKDVLDMSWSFTIDAFNGNVPLQGGTVTINTPITIDTAGVTTACNPVIFDPIIVTTDPPLGLPQDGEWDTQVDV